MSTHRTIPRFFLFLGSLILLLALAACGLQNPASESNDADQDPSSATRPSPSAVVATPIPTAATLDVADLDIASAPPTAAPTAVWSGFRPEEPIRLVIEAIGLEQPLIKVGLDENRMPIVPQHDVGWYEYSAMPGAGDNVVMWGHVLRFKDSPDIPAPFARLHEVQPGDEITVYAADGVVFPYTVTELVWATPEEIEYILPQGREQLTLVSCIGDKVITDAAVQMTHRLITIAQPQS